MKRAATGRPSRLAIALLVLALAGAVALAAVLADSSNWDLTLIALLGLIAALSDLTAVETGDSDIKLSGSFLTIVVAIVLLGATAAAIVSVMSILVGWLRPRYPARILLVNVVNYAWFPLLSGLVFNALVTRTGLAHMDPAYYLLVFVLFLVALALNFGVIAWYMSYEDRSPFWNKVRRALVPVLPSEVSSALLAVGVVWSYNKVGVTAIALAGVVLFTFQYLVGALLVSQQRADELEVRAKQLAGFQVALLGALLRTLDLRDRMTARHSAAVARYAREIAAAAGLDERDQELAHTAGLLHDIGKFVLPDRILKTNARLTEEDWVEIRKHPYEGARIVSQVDGYQPIGEIILAHHERPDGLGYPRGLQGEQVPVISRILAVADVYDVMTARDTYRDPVSSFEAFAEMRRVSGSQLDGRFVELFAKILSKKDFAYRHGEDVDFEAELSLERRIHEYVTSPRDTLTQQAGN
jgi:putative nucleotidyltransferase with HDIG domain